MRYVTAPLFNLFFLLTAWYFIKIDKRYMKRSMGQREFHQAFTVACLPHIIGEEEFGMAIHVTFAF